MALRRYEAVSFILQDVPRGLKWHAALSKRYMAVVLLRLAQYSGRRSGALASVLKQVNGILTGADIAWEASIGRGLCLYHPTGVVIGSAGVIGEDCQIESDVVLGGRAVGDEARPRLGDGVFLAAGCRVLGDVEVGDGAVIGANSVALKDVPARAVAVGIPARILER